MPAAYPLSWPQGWPRAQHRRSAAFSRKDSKGFMAPVTTEIGRKRLADELERLNAREIILSTNIELRADGHPKAQQRYMPDPGVAVYFTLKSKPTVLACDKWNTVGDNMVAIAKHIEALRGMDRWGVGSIEQAFAGYQALPAPDPWWKVLGLSEQGGRPVNIAWSEASIREAWARRSRECHPDRPGGSHDKMAAVNAARDEGLALIRQ